MLVLSRQVDETVMIGDAIFVTVVSISPEIATLHVCYDDEEQHVEQKCALEIDDRIEITDEVHVSVLDICTDNVRLAVKAPKSVTVHRKEVYEQLRRDERAVTPLPPIQLALGQRLHIGESVRVEFKEARPGWALIYCDGQIVGGAEDGMPFVREQSISVGTEIDFGTLVRISILELGKGAIKMHLVHPPLMRHRIQT